MLSPDVLRNQAREYYETKLSAHGPTPAGVDWNSHESQELRFSQLAYLWQNEPDASLLDYGCGYGALAAYVIDGRLPEAELRTWRTCLTVA